MDANNTPYFLLRTAEELRNGSRRLEWHPQHKALKLRQKQRVRLPTSTPEVALNEWATSRPMAVDEHYQVARLNALQTTVEFNSGGGWRPLMDEHGDAIMAPEGSELKDLSLNVSGRMAVPFSDQNAQHGVIVFDIGQRWQTQCVLPSQPLRAIVDQQDRIWCLSGGSLMLSEGEPLPEPYAGDPTRFEPLNINPNALRYLWEQSLPEGWLSLALCCDDTDLYVLTHDGDHNQRILRRSLAANEDIPFQSYDVDEQCPFAVDIAVAGNGRLALLAPQNEDDAAFVQRDCPVVSLLDTPPEDNPLNEPGLAYLIYERYPMLGLDEVRFASSADRQLRYQAPESADYPGFAPRPRELHALRQPRYEESTSALLPEILDSGSPGTQWHRVYLDACIPAGCSLRIAARVYDDPEDRSSADILMQPAPVWNSLPSEHPYQEAFSGYEENRRGLFEILLQRPEGPVRSMTGRYLQLQIHLAGNGSATPSLHAIRVYAPRFSYQEAYLPELFRQEQSFNPSNASGPANGADVRERLLACFESILTPLEGRVAASEQLLHPDTAPDESLSWLASAMGEDLPSHWPEARKRRWLANQTLIQQRKGTLPAINLALDIATDGGVQHGSVVVIENFRLRRTMATILGVDMDDRDHPLTLGTGITGNSLIGDSLILSEMTSREFLALFAPELSNDDERIAVSEFFDKYAHRISILLHGSARQQRTSVEDMLRQQLPAHLQWRIIETEHPFILGHSPLLSVDTWIEQRPAEQRVTINRTQIGREGLLVNPRAFSPRDINLRQSNGGAMT